MEDNNIQLPQRAFISQLADQNASGIFDGGQLIEDSMSIRRFFKSALGELLRLLQVRFGLSFPIIQIATSITPAVKDSVLAASITKAINKVTSKAKNNDLFINYGRLSGFSSIKEKGDMAGLRLFSRSDAGFATRRGERSIDHGLIILGREVSRDGSIICGGTIVGSVARCITRFVRSTLASEAAACANSMELCLWNRTCLADVLFNYDWALVLLRPVRL